MSALYYGEDKALTVVLQKQQRRKQCKKVFHTMDPLASIYDGNNCHAKLIAINLKKCTVILS